MFVIEYKIKGKGYQYKAIDEAIRTAQFVRNKALRFWMDNSKVSKYDLNKYSAILAKEWTMVNELNSTARQSSAERAWSSIARFYDNCKKQIKGNKGYPKFKRNTRSVEYKRSGWKLDEQTKKHITFRDKKGVGRLKLIGSRDLYFYQPEDIKRVRLIKRADGYYCQFCISVEVKIDNKPTGRWSKFREWLEYFGYKYGKVTVAVTPHYTSVNCSRCGTAVSKALSTRTHKCPNCKLELDRDVNAAINILIKALRTVGHTGTWEVDNLSNALGERTSTLVGSNACHSKLSL